MPVDENTLHPSNEEAADTIDAHFFNGDMSDEELQRYEFYFSRWNRKAVEIREWNAEQAEIARLARLAMEEENGR